MQGLYNLEGGEICTNKTGSVLFTLHSQKKLHHMASDVRMYMCGCTQSCVFAGDSAACESVRESTSAPVAAGATHRGGGGGRAGSARQAGGKGRLS